MVRLQADDLNGGIVVRRFETLAPGEVRVWWFDGTPVLVSPHPDAPGRVSPRPDAPGRVPPHPDTAVPVSSDPDTPGRVPPHPDAAVPVSPYPGAPVPDAWPGPDDLAPVAAAVARLGAPFVTTDLARGERGWRVVEVGDAQVSDLHRETHPFELWRPVLSGGFDRLVG